MEQETIKIQPQHRMYHLLFIIFGSLSFFILIYYLSNTLFYFTTAHQFPINSFKQFPLSLLIFPAEVFSLLFAMYFVYTLLNDKNNLSLPSPLSNKKNVNVALLLPIYNEPKEIIERTITACQKIQWQGRYTIFLLDDSTEKEHQQSVEDIAQRYGGKFTQKEKYVLRTSGNIVIIRRKDRIGYKAGNINNALKHYVKEDYFVIFDADQAPHKRFLIETMDYFSDPEISFVQTPQYFLNEQTPLERAAKIGANIFFQGQTMSKSKDGAMPFCGTNVVVRSESFRKVGGFLYYTSTEDIDLGIRLNEAGYKGVYVPMVLAYGYAPNNFRSYATQQYRWANGNLAILRQHWWRILFGKFSLRYQIHMLFTLGWWLIGVVSFMYIIIPIISLLTGMGTHHTWLPEALIVVLYINVILGIFMIYASLHKREPTTKVKLSDALLEYSLVTNSMFIYMKAAFAALIKKYARFIRTDKNYTVTGIRHITLNLFLAAVCFILSIYSLYQGMLSTEIIHLRTYIPISLWLLFYSIVLASAILFVGKPVISKETIKPLS